MVDVIKIVVSLEKWSLLIDSATETVKHEIKKTRWISWGYDGTYGCSIDRTYGIDTTMAFSLLNAITRKGQEDGFLPLLALPLTIKVLGREVRRARRQYNNVNKNV